MLFTWRYARPSTNNKEVFEIRMDGVLYASLEEPGLCRDFFSQFVHPQEPVSPRAKIGDIRHMTHDKSHMTHDINHSHHSSHKLSIFLL